MLLLVLISSLLVVVMAIIAIILVRSVDYDETEWLKNSSPPQCLCPIGKGSNPMLTVVVSFTSLVAGLAVLVVWFLRRGGE